MAVNKIPTSADIYLEVNGKRVAVVQSYRVTATRTAREVHAFGQEDPVATIRGTSHYELELSRIYASDTTQQGGLDFFALENFNLVISKDNERIIYSGCQWKQVQESAEVGGLAMEKVTITATGRMRDRG